MFELCEMAPFSELVRGVRFLSSGSGSEAVALVWSEFRIVLQIAWLV